MFMVIISSFGPKAGDYRPIEWKQIVEAKSQSAAMRKAWSLVADCGAERSDCKVRGEWPIRYIDIF